MSRTVHLDSVTPHSTDNPKGLKSYAPKGKTKPTIDRILDVYERMREADALPLGPRQVGYRLKELYPGEYTKAQFPAIGTIVKRLQQAGRLPWSWVADGSAVTYEVNGYARPEDYLADAESQYVRDRREDQPTVVEVFAEARETLGLIRRLGAERGVTVYSGGGSCGPNFARKAAARAVTRAVEHDQSTLILGICDFDLSGIRNVLRPHLDHLSAFLYGTADNRHVLAHRETTMWQAVASVSFTHLALTPEQATALVETVEDRDLIAAYMASGDDIWTRDVTLLSDVQKVETEAFDPVDLRSLVVDAIDSILDPEPLERIGQEEAAERQWLLDLGRGGQA